MQVRARWLLLQSAIQIYSSQVVQIQILALEKDKATTEILSKYTNYTDDFSPDLAIKLRKNTRINSQAIELILGKLPL